MADHRVGEVRIGHEQQDAVAAAKRVDMAERRQVGRAVPGDRRRRAAAGEWRVGVDARAALEVFGVGALDHHEARADVRDRDAPDRAAVARAPFELARQEGDPPPLGRQRREHAALDGGRRGVFDLAQRAAEVILLQLGVERGERLLPDERHAGVHERQPADRKQRDRQRAPQPRRAARREPRYAQSVGRSRCGRCLGHDYRRRADSVPPSDPGPA